MNREEKLRLVEILLKSSEWNWIKNEFEKQAILFEPTIHKKNDDFAQGVLTGIRWCIEYPEQARKDHQSFLERSLQKVEDAFK